MGYDLIDLKDMAIIVFSIMATLSFICVNANAKENISNIYAYRNANANPSTASIFSPNRKATELFSQK